jgi:hypothetical protein
MWVAPIRQPPLEGRRMDGHLQVQSPTAAAPTPTVSRSANGAQRPLRLLDQVRWQIRQLHYSRRTEDAYVYWCRAFIRFHGLRAGSARLNTQLPEISGLAAV